MDILFALVFTGLASAALWRSFKLKKEGVFAIGTVIKSFYVGGRNKEWLKIRFKTLNNSTVEFDAPISAVFFSAPKVGEQIPLLYNRHNSKEVVIYNVNYMWFAPIGAIIGGVALLFFSIMDRF